MTIQKVLDNGKVTLRLEGWLDTLSAPELGHAVEEIEAAEAIYLDFADVEYMASAGLRQVVACHKRAKELNAAFAVLNAGTETMSIFRLTGIDKKMDIRAK